MSTPRQDELVQLLGERFHVLQEHKRRLPIRLWAGGYRLGQELRRIAQRLTTKRNASTTAKPNGSARPHRPAGQERERELRDHLDRLEREQAALKASWAHRWAYESPSAALRPLSRVSIAQAEGLAVVIRSTSSRLASSIATGAVALLLVMSNGTQRLMASLRQLKATPRLDQQAAGALPAVAKLRWRPKVLIVMPYSIYPPNHGGAVRLYNLIRLLQREVDVHVLIFGRDGEIDGGGEGESVEQRWGLEALGTTLDSGDSTVSVFFHHWQPRFDHPAWRLKPPNALLFESSRAALAIRDLVERFGIDIVQLEYTELAQYHAFTGDAACVIVEHDIAHRSFSRRRQLGFDARYPDSRAFGATAIDGLKLQRYEVAACRRAEQLHTMSIDDARYLAPLLPDGDDRLWVVPNCVDTAYYRPDSEPERQGIVFVGNYQNLPNVDALEFFLESVWPTVRQRRPGLELDLVGAKMNDDIRALDGIDGVRVIGRVPDMRPAYQHHRILVVPLRAGSGTRLKLVEAFASGIAVVSTTLGAEGIDCQDDVHLLIADEPAAFVAAIERLLDDDELCERLGRSAMALVVDRYDWQVAAECNLAGIRQLLADRRPATPHPAFAPRDPVADATDVEREPAVDISIVMPTLNGGRLLRRTLERVRAQQIDRPYEILAVDSGSVAEDLATLREFGVRVHSIDKGQFNHGLTRDMAVSLARGDVVVLINQDAMPVDDSWLQQLTEPFWADPLEGAAALAGVQGGILELPEASDLVHRFFWDSCGQRFYFTRESNRWIERYAGMGFSTVNAAIRRDVWRQIPFGWAPIMEDKKWQRAVADAGLRLESRHLAAVHHTHDYDVRSLSRRCRSEGYGWRLLGESYTLTDMLKDMAQKQVLREWLRGLLRGEIRRPAEALFPFLRPWMLWRGNRWSRDVAL